MTTPKLLTLDGLTYLVQKIDTQLDGKVSKENGKSLSTNDYTTAEKVKLAGIDLSLYALKSDVTSVYRVKGSTTYDAMIALTNAQIGDVYTVTDKDGLNYVCIQANTTGAEAWDALGSVVDVDAITNGEIDNLFI